MLRDCDIDIDRALAGIEAAALAMELRGLDDLIASLFREIVPIRQYALGSISERSGSTISNCQLSSSMARARDLVTLMTALHVHYGETVLHMHDGLPKQKDLPAEMGGSGVLLPE